MQNSPQIEDSSHTGLWFALMLAAEVVIAEILRRKKNITENNLFSALYGNFRLLAQVFNDIAEAFYSFAGC